MLGRITRRAAVLALGCCTIGAVAASTAAAVPPANDDFANRTTIGPALPINDFAGTTVDATNEAGEPDHPNGGGAFNSIWYEWVAPASQTVKVDACDSNSFVALGVYTGNAVNALSGAPGAANNGGCLYTFNAVAATSYKIALDGDGGEDTTSLTIRVLSPPANDNFASAIGVGAGAFSQAGTNVDATLQAGEFTAANIGGSDHTVWYTWTPASSSQFTMNTCTSTFDSTLGVYTGGAVNALSTVASDDDTCTAPNGVGSLVTFAASAGTVYRIAVGGFSSGDEGTFTLAGTVATPATPATPAVPGVTPAIPASPAANKKCKKGFKKVKGKCKKVKKKKKK